MNRLILKFLVAALAAAAFAAPLARAVNLSSIYAQNFDSMGTTGIAAPADWTVHAYTVGTSTTWAASIPAATVSNAGTANATLTAATTYTATSATQGFNYALGTATSDRALGVSPTTVQGLALQLTLTNTTGAPLSGVRVAYDIRRFSVSAGVNELPGYWLFYSIDNGATWTNVAALNPTAAGPSGVIVPNTIGVTTAPLTAITFASPLANNANLLLRWVDDNAVTYSPDQICGLDNVVVAVPLTPTGKSALWFDGANDYVTMGAAPALNAGGPPSNGFTIECWFRKEGTGLTSSSGSGGVVGVPLFGKGRGEAEASNVDCDYFFGINSGGQLVADFEAYPASGVTSGQNYPVTATNPAIVNNTWYHAAATYDGATFTWKLYLNGAQVGTATAAANALPRYDSIQHFGIGAAMTSTGAREGAFAGRIDEVRVWNYARSAAEIASGKDAEIVSATGLIGRYGLDETTGTTAGNSAGIAGAPIGTLTNGPIWTEGPSFTPNVLPTVSLTAPIAGGSVTFPAVVNLAASAADSDGTITKVEFYDGATKLSEDLTAPYAYEWTDATLGTHTLTAKAFDNSGGSTTSGGVAFEVLPNANQPPVVTLIGPADQATGVGSVTTLALSFADPEGDGATVTFYGRKTAPAVAGADFSIATLPDTQFYAENLNNNGRSATFHAQTQWLLDNRNSAAMPNLAFVSHMGDIVQNGDAAPAEWLVADAALKTLENPATAFRAYGIPWGVAPGNHDQTSIGNAGGANAYYNQYFGASRFLGRNYWGGSQSGSNNNNNFQLFSANGLDFIIIHLEYDTRAKSFYQPVLDWADAILKAYPNRRAIITSHWIVNTGNPASFSAQGQAIYDDLKDNPNLFLMLCGHVAGEGRRADVFEGRTVYSVLQDYQGRVNGGDGWLRYFVFSPANNTITAKTYKVANPITANSGFETDADSEFVLPYNLQSAVTAWIPLGTVNVPAGGSTAEVSWTGLEKSSDYEWYAVVDDGINPITTATRRFATVTAVAPTVTLTSPAANANYGLPATITLAAEASDADGAIARVDFFNGSSKIGEATTAPYTSTWANVTGGTYAITAVATDDSGLSTISSVAYITVTNTPPSVVLTAPLAGDSFDALANFNLVAEAADTDGAVSKVEFFNGAIKLGEATVAPYQFAWSNVVTGTYVLTAKATDDQGLVTTSAAINVTVTNLDNLAPTIALTAPTNGATPYSGTIELAATAADTDGTVSKVEFYVGATKLGEDLSVPYAFSWIGVTPGSYTLTAVATDNDSGVSTSTPVAITVIQAPASFGYLQNFDGLGTGTALGTAGSGTLGWSFLGNLGGDNNTWKNANGIPASGALSAATAGTANAILTVNSNAAAANSSSNTAGINFALSGSTADRALGTAPTSGAGLVLQLVLTNTSGAGINAFDIGYDIRRFTVAMTGNPAVATANELPGYQLFYSLDGGTTWTNVASLNPVLTGGSINVPNTAGVTAVPATAITLASTWDAGASLRLRWIDDNAQETSPDQIIALDNVTLTATQFVVIVGQPPVVALTAPAANATYLAPASVALTADATDSDGSIAKVEFYQGTTKLGETTSAPYTFTWNNVAAGTYTLTAKATDNNGNVTTSVAIGITVNVPPGSSGTLLRGPYLNMANQNSIVVRWRSSLATIGRVRYGTAPDNLNQFLDEATTQTNHEVRLTGLAPLTRYYYSVGSAVDSLTPETADTTSFRPASVPAVPSASDYTFRTSPVPGSATDTRVWIVGDCGRGSTSQASGRDAYYTWMGSRVPDLNLQMGDNAYNSGTDTEYQTGYFLMYPSIFRKMPQWSTLGNHDANNGVTNPTTNFPYFDMFTFPTAGEAGGVASGTEHYYSFDYGNIHFICLDSQASSTATLEKNGADGPMAAWLRQDLAATTSTWIIAFWHHPPYSKGSHDSDTEGQMVNMRTNFNPILEGGGVDLVFLGHSHNYERSVLLDGHYGISSTISAAMKLNAGNGSTNGFTTGANGVIRNAANGFTAVATVNGAVIPPDGAYRKPLTGPRDHFGAVYNTAGMSGLADAGTINHTAMYISYNTVGTVNVDVNGNTLVATYVQAGGTVPDNYTIVKQGAADSDADGIPDEYEIANGLNRTSALDADLDLDGDGLSNRLEYALSTAANLPNRTGLPVLGQGAGADAGKLTLTFSRARSELTYIVQASDDLRVWNDIATNPGASGASVLVTDSNTTSPNRYLRLKVTDSIATVMTTPVGRITYTLTQNQETAVSFPLHDVIGSVSGQPAGFITAVGTSTLDNTNAGWTPAQFSQVAAPYYVHLLSGAASGFIFPVATTAGSENTATRLTLSTGGVDLTALGIVAGTDTYEMLPADTLGNLFPLGTLLSGTANTADTLRLWNGSTWVTYYHDGANWQRQGAGLADNTLVRPDQGWMLLRRGPTKNLVLFGEVSSTNAKASVQRGGSSYISLLPVAQTFAEFSLQTLLPNWSSNPASPTTGDHVRLWNGSLWLNYYYSGTKWMRQGAGDASTTVLLKPGRPIYIVRPAGTGSNTLNQNKTY